MRDKYQFGMAESRREQIKILFEQVLDLPVKKREAFLENACSGDVELRREIDSLLVHVSHASGFFEELAEGILQKKKASLINKPDSFSGQRIAHYKELELLGRGGMGVVYKARDLKLDRMVALKFLTHDLSTNTEAKERFVLEAKAASALDHPNIGTIYEINETDDGLLYIAMAYYEGNTLQDVIAQRSLSIEEIEDYTCQISEGLAKAHAAGIVHRDIKPANLILTNEGQIKIIDFGLAKMSGAEQLAKTGTLLGTMAYMSPEQIQGIEINYQADLWALGVIFYEMLAGERPFKGTNESSLLYSIVHEEPEDLRRFRTDLPNSIVCLTDKLLKKETGGRIQQAEDVVTELQNSSLRSRENVKLTRNALRIFVWPSLVALLIIIVTILVGDKIGIGDLSASSKILNLDNHRIAILPFDIHEGDPSANLRENMVEVLHLAIQGSEEVSSIDPNAMFVHTDGDVMASKDPERGNEIAENFDAGWYLLSRISRVGENLHLVPRLYKTGGEHIDLDPISLSNELHIQQVADTLGTKILQIILDRPENLIRDLATQTTSSPTAFRHFLRGRRLFTKRHYEEAVDAFQQALREDSTFAVAAIQLGWAYHFITGHSDMEQRRVFFQADRHLDQLPLAKRWFLQAEIESWIKGNPDVAEPLYRKYLIRYPDDVYAHVSFGDFLFHYNPPRGRSADEAIKHFNYSFKSVDAVEVLGHLYHRESWKGNVEFLSEIEAYSDSVRGVKPSELRRMFRRMVKSIPDNRGPLIDSLAERKYMFLTDLLAVQIEDIPGALRSNKYDPEPQRSRMKVALETASGHFQMLNASNPDSHLTDSGSLLFIKVRSAAVPFSQVSVELLESYRNIVADWDVNASRFHKGYADQEAVRIYLLGILSYRLSDHNALVHYADLAQQRVTENIGDEHSLVVFHTLSVLIEENNIDQAERHFHEARIPFPTFYHTFDSPLNTQDYARYVIAERLFNAGRIKEALPWYSSFVDGYDVDGLLYLGPAYMRRAQIYEALGETNKAITFYTRFIELWKDADPGLQQIVEDMKLRLNSLQALPLVDSK